MKKAFFIFYLLMLPAMALRAQYTITGKIEYERKMNIHAQLNDMKDNDDDNPWIERMKERAPKFMSTYFDMSFDTLRSEYKPGREVEQQFKMFGGDIATANVVYTDFAARRVTAKKDIYEQEFKVEDTMRTMRWQAKDELRTIAGFKCYKAVGRICDSVYVVAFYTEDIPVSGGPEMFGGLPGMILELAIPRLHTTWTATKLDVAPPKDTDFTIPSKGKKVTEQGLYETIKLSFKDWGKMAQSNVWWALL